jgi:hypothetical protein
MKKASKKWAPGDVWRSPVTVVKGSKVSKFIKRGNGSMAATYASQASCPPCDWKGNGCYAEHGLVGFVTNRLNSNGETDPIVIAKTEAADIDTLTAPKKLRVHVVGDSATPAAAKITGAAMVRYEARTGSPAYTYTHAWDRVPARHWGQARVLASVHSEDGARQATTAGYRGVALSRTERHPSRRAYKVDGFSLTVIPCPAQFKDSPVGCANCKLCESRTLTERGFAIGFQPDSLPKV